MCTNEIGQKKKKKITPITAPHPNLIVCIGLGPRALLCSLGTLLPNFRLHSIIYLLHQTPSNVQASLNAYGISREKNIIDEFIWEIKNKVNELHGRDYRPRLCDKITGGDKSLVFLTQTQKIFGKRCKVWVLETGAHKIIHAF